jgi:hypothetical protein
MPQFTALRLARASDDRIVWRELGIIEALDIASAFELAKTLWRFVPPGYLAVEPLKH